MDLQLLRWKRDVFFVGHTSLCSGSQSRCSHPFFAQRSFGFHREQFVVSFVCTNMSAQLSINSSVNVRAMHLGCLKKLNLASGCCVVVKMDLSIALVRSCESTQSMSAVSLFVGGSPWSRYVFSFILQVVQSLAQSQYLDEYIFKVAEGISSHTMGTWLWAPWRALLASPNYWLLGLLGLEILEWGRCQRSDVEILLKRL